MPTMRIGFPGGRYHATPWGHHVNEGLIEWPPCPWRLLRALIATGYAKLGWGDGVPDAGRRLIEALAETLPKYHLPPASGAHSRHYMPLGKLDKGREKTTLVFDTWANVGDGKMVIHWDCNVDDDARDLFRRLVGNLGYLGRSESWVTAEAVDDESAAAIEFNAYPHIEGHNPGPGWEQVSLLAPERPAEYDEWRQHAVSRAEEQADAATEQAAARKDKKPTKADITKARTKAAAPYPLDLLDALQKDTAWWKGHKWSQPPGSRRVIYWRQADALQVSPPVRPRSRMAKPVTTMLLALTTPSGNTSALPHISRTLPQAELLHAALIRKAANGQSIHCPELTGLGESGNPLQKGHHHAHILPLDLDQDQHIDHVFIYAPMGLGSEAQKAIRSLRRTWTKSGVGELQLAIAGCGDVNDIRCIPAPLRHQIDSLLGSSNGSINWISKTPFVPPRYLKKNGKNSLPNQVKAELISRGLPASVAVTILSPHTSEIARVLRHHVRTRRRGGAAPPVDIGLTLRLEFEEPVTGPLVLGYGCHFGLGLFVAEGE